MRQYFKTHYFFIILGYLIGMIIGSLLSIVILYNVASSLFDIPFSECSKILMLESLKDEPQNVVDCYYFIQSWSNFISYLVVFIITVFYARGYFKEDFRDIKKSNKKKKIYNIILALCGCVLLYYSSYFFTFIANKITGQENSVSTNQSSFENMILNGYGIIVFFAVFLLAPVSEELVYRKSIFKIFERFNVKWFIPIIVSALIFAIPHMTSTKMSVVWPIYLLSYLTSGLILSFVYHFSNKNIYVSILCHMLNNLVAFLLIII